MIPLAEPNLNGNESKFLQKCISSGYVSSTGPYIKEFEDKLSLLTGGKYTVSTSSGTSALHLALKSYEIGYGDIVIVPAYSFVASANSVSMSGASPWFIDIESKSWTLDCNLLDEQLSSETFWKGDHIFHNKTGQKIACIMPVNTLGIVCNIDAVEQIAKKYNLKVIIDGAASIGSEYMESKIAKNITGLITFSFNGNKIVTTGGGGSVVGNDEKLMELIKEKSGTGKRFSGSYNHTVIGYNHKMTNVEAAIGCAQLDRVDEFIYNKRKIHERYNHAIKNFPGLSPIPCPEWSLSSSWMSGIQVNRKIYPNIHKITEYLHSKDIEAKLFWQNLSNQVPYKKHLSSKTDVTEKVANEFIALPCSTNLDEDSQDIIINKFFEALKISI
ncbi:MAG: GDP-perosamine synthase [Alphaproteobacteria bacterium MarineAlpha2_Bin1]|nr:MAG: GDP-perosamine synthase [Alphaproteobacteria bacterium MarineAlpha2_Bin1]